MSLTLLPTQRCKDRVDVLSVAAVSRSGRFSVRRHVAALGWEPGSALDFEVLPVAVLIRQTSRGRHRIDDRGQLFLPSGPRALLGLSAGDRVVVMTVPDHEVLLVQPLNAVLSQLTQQCSLLSSPQPADTYDVDIEVMAYQDTAGPDVDGDPHAVAGR
jgi:AbrB family looped-hinge helix DNA binding protein